MSGAMELGPVWGASVIVVKARGAGLFVWVFDRMPWTRTGSGVILDSGWICAQGNGNR